MNERGLAPNIRTLNIVLDLLSRMALDHDRKKKALKMIAEVKQFNVEPSLGSYHFLLLIFCSNSGKKLTRNRTYYRNRASGLLIQETIVISLLELEIWTLYLILFMINIISVFMK